MLDLDTMDGILGGETDDDADDDDMDIRESDDDEDDDDDGDWLLVLPLDDNVDSLASTP